MQRLEHLIDTTGLKVFVIEGRWHAAKRIWRGRWKVSSVLLKR